MRDQHTITLSKTRHDIILSLLYNRIIKGIANESIVTNSFSVMYMLLIYFYTFEYYFRVIPRNLPASATLT